MFPFLSHRLFDDCPVVKGGKGQPGAVSWQLSRPRLGITIVPRSGRRSLPARLPCHGRSSPQLATGHYPGPPSIKTFLILFPSTSLRTLTSSFLLQNPQSHLHSRPTVRPTRSNQTPESAHPSHKVQTSPRCKHVTSQLRPPEGHRAFPRFFYRLKHIIINSVF
jgi:hypothetical protein